MQNLLSRSFIVKIALVSCLATGISACTTTGCDQFHTYRYEKAQEPVKVPADLEQPDNEFLSPEVDNNDPDKIDRRASGECLEKPPKI